MLQMTVMMKKKEVKVMSRKIIIIKGSHLMVLVKLKISSAVVIVLVHPAEVQVLIRCGEAASPHVVLAFRSGGILVVLVLHFVVGIITIILESVKVVVVTCG